MRKFLFKGKTITTNKWIYGGYNYANGSHFIIKSNTDPKYGAFTVYEDSVGLCTGKFDSDGCLIFENDIVYIFSRYRCAAIKWDKEANMFVIEFDGLCTNFANFDSHDCKIVGNIFDDTAEE